MQKRRLEELNDFFKGREYENYFIQRIEKLSQLRNFEFAIFQTDLKSIVYLSKNFKNMFKIENLKIGSSIDNFLNAMSTCDNFNVLDDFVCSKKENQIIITLNTFGNIVKYQITIKNAYDSYQNEVFRVIIATIIMQTDLTKEKAFKSKSQNDFLIPMRTVDSNKTSQRYCSVDGFSLGANTLRLPTYEFSRIVSHNFMFHHNSGFVKCSKLFTLFVILYILFSVSFFEAFTEISQPEAFIAIDLLFEFFLIWDIIRRFRTTIVSSDYHLTITDPKRIAIKYVKTWFFPDLIAAFPYTLFYKLGNGLKQHHIRLMKLLKTLNVAYVIRGFQFFYTYGIYTFLLMILTIIVMMHILACIWYGITTSSQDMSNPNSWINILKSNHHNSSTTGNNSTSLSVGTLYLTSLYFVLTSFSTVGFGNVSPNTNSEMIMSVIFMFLGIISYAVIINQMSIILTNLQSRNITAYDLKNRVKAILKQYVLNQHDRKILVKKLTQKYYNKENSDRMLHIQSYENYKGRCIKPFFLKIDEVLLNSPIFRFPELYSNLDSLVLRTAVSNICKISYLDSMDNLIYSEQPISYFYIILDGSIEIKYGTKIYSILKSGDYFGLDISDKVANSFEIPRISKYHVTTLTRCMILLFELSDYQSIIELHPKINSVMTSYFSSTLKLDCDPVSVNGA